MDRVLIPSLSLSRGANETNNNASTGTISKNVILYTPATLMVAKTANGPCLYLIQATKTTNNNTLLAQPANKTQEESPKTDLQSSGDKNHLHLQPTETGESPLQILSRAASMIEEQDGQKAVLELAAKEKRCDLSPSLKERIHPKFRKASLVHSTSSNSSSSESTSDVLNLAPLRRPSSSPQPGSAPMDASNAKDQDGPLDFSLKKRPRRSPSPPPAANPLPPPPYRSNPLRQGSPPVYRSTPLSRNPLTNPPAHPSSSSPVSHLPVAAPPTFQHHQHLSAFSSPHSTVTSSSSSMRPPPPSYASPIHVGVRPSSSSAQSSPESPTIDVVTTPPSGSFAGLPPPPSYAESTANRHHHFTSASQLLAAATAASPDSTSSSNISVTSSTESGSPMNQQVTRIKEITIITNESADPMLDEHFRRSLGANYQSIFGDNKNKPKANNEEKSGPSSSCKTGKENKTGSSSASSNNNGVSTSSNESSSEDAKAKEENNEAGARVKGEVKDPVKAFHEEMEMEGSGFSVEDHFAKALGDTWVKLQAQRKLESEGKKAQGETTKEPAKKVGVIASL